MPLDNFFQMVAAALLEIDQQPVGEVVAENVIPPTPPTPPPTPLVEVPVATGPAVNSPAVNSPVSYVERPHE